MGPKIFRRCEKIAPGIDEGRIHVCITRGSAAHCTHCPAVFHNPRTQRQHRFVTTIIGNTLQKAAALFHVCGFRYDVQRAAHRVDGQLRSSESSLHLHGIDSVP